MIVERNADARGQMPIRSLSTDVICPACGTRRLCDYPFEAGKRKRPDCKHEWKEKIEELEGQRITPEEARAVSDGRNWGIQSYTEWGKLYDSCIVKLKSIAKGDTK
jgi:hypothetical protein